MKITRNPQDISQFALIKGIIFKQKNKNRD
jgi:hypothetical protein